MGGVTHQRLPIARIGLGFQAADEGGAQLYGTGAQTQRRGDTRPIHDATRGNHRDVEPAHQTPRFFLAGDGGDGVVFELTPGKNGHWKYIPLRSFYGPDGNGPSYGLVLDGKGNLYGTTWTGGTYGNGTVFEITP